MRAIVVHGGPVGARPRRKPCAPRPRGLLADDHDTLQALARLTRSAATPTMAVALYRHIWEELDVREDLT